MDPKKVRYSFPDGREYVGMVKDGHPDGIGTMTFPNGDTYEGLWAEGRMEGKGVYRFYDAGKDRFTSEYDGTFYSNVMEGQGKRVYPDKTVYVGAWQNGMRTGNGAVWFTDGSYFYGIWKFDKMVRGVMHLPTGDIYDGEFKNGIFEGFGKYFCKQDGTVFEGLFKNGNPFRGVTVYPDMRMEKVDRESKADKA